MLSQLFISVLNMSFISSYTIIFVLIARWLLRTIPKIYSYTLWGIVLFRLLCPFSFESMVSLIPMRKNPIPQDIVYGTTPQIATGIALVDNSNSVNPIQIWILSGAVIWIAGILLMLIYSIASMIKLKRALIGAVSFKRNIYLADHIASPFVMGLIRPKIYLPSSLLESEKGYVIAHEMCHIRRIDHLTRILAFMALAFHWFNPLVWIAWVISGKDMELSADETVMKKMNTDIRKEYSQSLLRFGSVKKTIQVTPLAFGESDIKNRVKNVLKYKKPTFGVAVVAIVAIAVISVGLITNPTNTVLFIETESSITPVMGIGSAKTLWESRTKYVGDNSAVGHLLGLLSIPKDLQHDHFELLTSGDERGIRWYLNEMKNTPYSIDEFQLSALLLFALIDNLDDVSVIVNDSAGTGTDLYFDRAWANKIVDGDVRDFADSIETLQTLIDLAITTPLVKNSGL